LLIFNFYINDNQRQLNQYNILNISNKMIQLLNRYHYLKLVGM